jgi:hypothetical protein
LDFGGQYAGLDICFPFILSFIESFKPFIALSTKGIRVKQEIQYRVFALSSEDIFPKGDLLFALKWLRTKGNKPYYFQNKKPRNLGVGSFILFSFEGQVFGRARTSELVTVLSEIEQREIEAETGFHDTGTVRFNPISIEVFSDQLYKKQITAEIGIKFSRNFTKLTKVEYDQIVRMAGSMPKEKPFSVS